MPRRPRRAFRLPWRTARALRDDVDEELRFHLDMRAAELMARRGLDAQAARDEALRQFGDVDDARQYMSAMDRRTETTARRREHVETMLQDVRHAWRGLRRSPGFAAVVVLALALGIGATTAIYTMVDAVLLRPLPVPNPGQLVAFGDPSLVGTTNTGPLRTDIFSYEMYRTLRDRTRLVPSLAATGYSARLAVVIPDSSGGGAGAAARPDGEPEQVRGRLVSGNYFDMLGVRAVAGRTITPADDGAPGAGPVAVISHGYWQRRFALDPAVIGRTILVNRAPVTIVGIAPPGFGGEVVGHWSDIWMPLTMQPALLPNQDWLRSRHTTWLMLIGRLRPEATVAHAGSELTTLARQALAEGPDARPEAETRTATVPAYSARRGIVGVPRAAQTAMVTMLALAGLVLVVVGANVANLLLARAMSRRTEIGVRLALGAGRGRVMRYLLVESVLLGMAAGALALVVVQAGIALLIRRAAASGGGVPLDLSLDPRVLAFAAALSLATALLLGLVPAVHTTRLDLGAALRATARGVSGSALGGGGRGWRFGFGQWLVVGQVALSLVLLAGTGLLVRSARNLDGVDAGLARDELLVVSVDAHTTGYDAERLRDLYARIGDRLRQLPGVRDVTWSQNGLFSGIETTLTLQVPGFVARSPEDSSANYDAVAAGYFRTIGARLLRGRDIEPRDDARAPRVAVINETMARHYFAGRDPLGQRLRLDTTEIEVVGVVADVRTQSLRADPTRRFYASYAQSGGGGLVVFTLRAPGDGAAARLATAARREVLAEHAALRVRGAEPLATLMRESIAPELLVAGLAGVAGGLALALTALGLYGVMTYTTVRRTGEFGLRMALGARPSDVTRLVLRETGRLVLFGAAVGLPAALGAGALLRHQLVGVGVADPPTLAAALAVLSAVAALAAYRPARRASRVEPQEALKD